MIFLKRRGSISPFALREDWVSHIRQLRLHVLLISMTILPGLSESSAFSAAAHFRKKAVRLRLSAESGAIFVQIRSKKYFSLALCFPKTNLAYRRTRRFFRQAAEFFVMLFWEFVSILQFSIIHLY